jgi:ATP-dependent DNA helicase RecQ
MDPLRPATSTDPRLHATLRRVWGFDQLRPLQAEAMAAHLQGRDSLVVLPTGSGKSLCFQVPAVVSGGLTLVVSPLIALMKDQVDALLAQGVAAAAFNSSLEGSARAAVLGRLRSRELRLLYVAPERLAADGSPAFLALLRAAGLSAVAVDEAHCISEWGHDFRPEYRQLGALRETLPGVSFHAYTATATPQVREDVVRQLQLQDPLVLVGSFDRPNLIYRVRRRQQLARQVREVVAAHRGEAGIVYCTSRREVEALASALQAERFAALAYHAGLPDAERGRVQDAFLGERADVVVATVAFGMGIDRPDVRYVLHAGAPRSLEQYLQEAGRAGRDGLPAECVLLYSPGDVARWRGRLERDGALTEANVLHLRRIETYAGSASCRHRSLAAHFGERMPETACGACDLCLGELEEVPGSTVLAQKVLSCVARVKQSFGAGHVIDVLRGRQTSRVEQHGHQELSTFGLLAELSVAELRGYLDQLVDQGLLAPEGDRFPVLRLTAEGGELLRGRRETALLRVHVPAGGERRRERRRGRLAAPVAAGAAGAASAGEEALFERLRALRREIAAERGVPPYVVFHDVTLRELARERPRSMRELLAVKGIGERKALDYGERLLALLSEGEGAEPALPPTTRASAGGEADQRDDAPAADEIPWGLR